jgi:hypothetical protein
MKYLREERLNSCTFSGKLENHWPGQWFSVCWNTVVKRRAAAVQGEGEHLKGGFRRLFASASNTNPERSGAGLI